MTNIGKLPELVPSSFGLLWCSFRLFRWCERVELVSFNTALQP